jgi:hypothetical protein
MFKIRALTIDRQVQELFNLGIYSQNENEISVKFEPDTFPLLLN